MRFVVLITFKVTAGLIHPVLLSGLTLVEWFGIKRLLTEKLHGSGLTSFNMVLFKFTV